MGLDERMVGSKFANDLFHVALKVGDLIISVLRLLDQALELGMKTTHRSCCDLLSVELLVQGALQDLL